MFPRAGAPQGSGLCSLYFVVFIDDAKLCLLLNHFGFFVDDIVICPRLDQPLSSLLDSVESLGHGLMRVS